MANKSRGVPEINAGSMADIAFLLLIFFLVTTTMDIDQGLMVKLPPIPPVDQPPPVIKERNVFKVLVNANNQLLVEDQYITIDKLRKMTREFITNNGKDENSSENPDKAIISLKSDRGTKYETYVQVQNELRGAYNELREEEAQRQYGRKFSQLTSRQQDAIIDKFPQKISEAEPEKFGEEK